MFYIKWERIKNKSLGSGSHYDFNSSVQFPTDPFTLPEPQNQEIDGRCVSRKCLSNYFETLNLQKGRSGGCCCKDARFGLSISFFVVQGLIWVWILSNTICMVLSHLHLIMFKRMGAYWAYFSINVKPYGLFFYNYHTHEKPDTSCDLATILAINYT